MPNYGLPARPPKSNVRVNATEIYKLALLQMSLDGGEGQIDKFLKTNIADTGWSSYEEMVAGGGIVVFQKEDEMTAITQPMTEIVMTEAGEDLLEALEQGRMCIRRKDGGLHQLIPGKGDDAETFEMDFSGKIDTLPGLLTKPLGKLGEVVEEAPKTEEVRSEEKEEVVIEAKPGFIPPQSEEKKEAVEKKEEVEEKKEAVIEEKQEAKPRSRYADMASKDINTWRSSFEDSVKTYGGWMSLPAAVDAGAISILDKEGNPHAVEDINFLSDFGGTGRKECIDASFEGRLQFQKRGSEGIYSFSTEYIDRKPGSEISPIEIGIKQVNPEVFEREEEARRRTETKRPTAITTKPTAPSNLFFKRIVNAIFGGYKEELNWYDSRMARYNEYLNAKTIRAEEQRAPEKDSVERPPESLDHFFRDETIRSLQTTQKEKAPLDSAALNDLATRETAELLDGIFQRGVDARLRTIGTLQQGKYKTVDFETFEEALGNVMLGEMVRRSVTDTDAQKKATFYHNIGKDPERLTAWRRAMLDTPAAREVLAQGAEGLGRVMGNHVQLAQLMNKVLPQADKMMKPMEAAPAKEKTAVKTAAPKDKDSKQTVAGKK